MDSAKALVGWVGLCEEILDIDFVIRGRGFITGREEGDKDLNGGGLSSSSGILTVPS
jgi:hypothetical protein